MSAFVDSIDPCPHCWDEGGAVCIPASSTLQKEDCAYCFCTPAHGTGLFICMCCHESVCEEHIPKHRATHKDTGSHCLYTKISRLPPRLTDEDVIDAVVAAKKDGDNDTADMKKALMGEVSKDVNQLGVISEPPAYDYRVVCVDCNQIFSPAVSSPDCPVREGQREGDLNTEFAFINGAFKAIVHAASVAVRGSESGGVSADAEDPYRNSIVCQHTSNFVQDTPSRYVDVSTGASLMPADPATLKCHLCDCKSNNWLCMICGEVGCPRVEAGGNGHAITHFEATGHSVVLKLGTVTPKGADLYCYACDTEVKDPKLAEHLTFFGINMDSATKTAKSLGEMAYDLTMQHDYKAICDVGEDGKSTLKPAFGANALTGMHNFGNTCYLASAMQVLISTSTDFRRAFLDGKHIHGCTSKTPRDCFGCQLEKFATAVYSDRFSHTPEQVAVSYDTNRGISTQSASAQETALKRFEAAVAEELTALSSSADGHKPLCVTLKSASRPRQSKLSSDIVNGVTPRDLKRVLANGRADFLSGDQQDAQEFIAHVLALARAKVVGSGGAGTRTAGGKSERQDDVDANGCIIVDPSHSTRIEVVARKECLGCQRVAYARNLEDTVRLSNPIDPSSLPAPSTNKDDPEPPRPTVNLQEVFERFVSPSMVEGARCEDCSARDGFITTNCLANLPEVLVFDVNRQYFDISTLSTKKMNVLVVPPQTVDLSFLKGNNAPQPGEQTLSSHSSVVKSTTDAVYADAPSTSATTTTAATPAAVVVAVDEMALVQMISMGIDQPIAEWALRKTNNNLDQAIDAVFSGAAPSVEELLMQQTTAPPAAPATSAPPTTATSDNGNESVDGSVVLSDVANGASTTYHLSAMISHVGSSAQTGHYVCHIRKPKTTVTSEAFEGAGDADDEHCWVSYNDEKVGVTTKPPFGQASTYVYRRAL